MLALALPKAEEGTSYGTPGFKVGGTLFARFHQDGESLVVRIDQNERSMRIKADPQNVLHHGSLSELSLDSGADRVRRP